MDKEITLELHDETLVKLDKLAEERGVSREELINQSLRDLSKTNNQGESPLIVFKFQPEPEPDETESSGS